MGPPTRPVSPGGLKVCVKCIDEFEGYFHDELASSTALTSDGFYRTGDIGEQLREGVIRIVDRKAHIVKLATGKFCSLEEVDEQVAAAHPAVEQVCALELRGRIVAVVHAPTAVGPLPWLGVPHVCTTEPFTAANGLLTPSLKLCRRAVRERHAADLEALAAAAAEGGDLVARWLAAWRQGRCDGDVDDTLPLASLGVGSVQFARLAGELGVPVHAVAAARTLADLKVLAAAHSTAERHSLPGLTTARTDFEAFVRRGAALRAAAALGEASAAALPSPPTLGVAKVVLVTGATGHIGREFAELLASRGFEVTRAARSLGFDISSPRFGLSEEAYSALAARCDAVVHCAAVVNWSLSYDALRGANVEGTWNVVEFCHAGGRGEIPLLFVGSGAGWPECPALSEWLEECDSPYMMSKLVSEAMVHVACQRAVVVRPGLVVWHSVTGAHRDDDAVSRVLRAACASEIFWTDDAGDMMDGMNVDTLCELAWALFERGRPEVYSLRGAFPVRSLASALDDIAVASSVRLVRYEEWYETMSRQCAADATHPMVPLLPHLDSRCPPFASPAPLVELLSKRCLDALGPTMASRALAGAGGMVAFAAELRRRLAPAAAAGKRASTTSCG